MTVPGDVFDYDTELRLHNEHLRAAARVGPRDRVLDLGCGAGLTTRQAARAAPAGSATGVDLSARMLDRARQLAADEGLTNVTFEQADAQTHRFPPEHFDLCISRFGTMFFADPGAAFDNIRGALRPGGRLVMIVWQGPDLNEWVAAIRQPGVAMAPADGPGMFSLADPVITRGILTTAGYSNITFTEVDEPVYYGADSAAALDAVLSLWEDQALADLDTATAERALARLRDYLDAHRSDGGVLLDSRAWIVTAQT
jgi:SAM-dependent methyltransferase|nr:methyltransferase [Aeromicrobium sp.]